MNKSVRNSVFTAVALGLTIIGIHWNKEIARQSDPLAVSRSVLASQPLGEGEQMFPLTIDFALPVMKLGQTQEMIITTAPYAELEIITYYPDGSINNEQTLIATADKYGRFHKKFKLNSFENLGIFRTSVIATSATKTSEAAQVFALQPWSVSSDIENEPTKYYHPLVP